MTDNSEYQQSSNRSLNDNILLDVNAHNRSQAIFEHSENDADQSDFSNEQEISGRDQLTESQVSEDTHHFPTQGQQRERNRLT